MGSRAIDSIKELQGPQVRIKHPDHVDHLIAEIIKGGAERLQVVADFDMTLSAFSLKGKRCVSCHKALDDCPKLSDTYRQKAYGLRDHFYPLEVDPALTIDEKVPLMVEWYTKSHDLMMELDLDQSDICHIVRDSNLKLREGCDAFFKDLHQHKVPVLIFSAGIGNIIEEAIKQQSHMYDNMHIVSNFMDFNEQGKLVGFKGELIHTFNKRESAVHDSDYFQSLNMHTNIMLLGDSLGDLHMADGACGSNVLTIGFLNDKIEESLDTYMDAYDIVLISDETLDVARALLDKVFSE